MSTNVTPAPLLAFIFLLLALTAIVFPLLPLELEAESPALPDILLALTAAWVLRRPDSVPVLLIVPVFLFADFILGRPPGLWTLLALTMTELLRIQAAGQNDRPFLIEWFTFTVFVMLMLLIQGVLLSLTLSPTPNMDHVLGLFAKTVLLYPVIVFLLYYVFRVRAPRDVEGSARLGRVG